MELKSICYIHIIQKPKKVIMNRFKNFQTFSYSSLILLLFFAVPDGHTQSKEIIPLNHSCATEITEEVFDAFLEHKQRNLSSYESQNRSGTPFTVPVRVIVLRRSDGTGSFWINSTSDVDDFILNLNDSYQGTVVDFIHCGDPIFIDSDYYYNEFLDGNLDFNNFTNDLYIDLAYFSSDANFYVPAPGMGGRSSAEWPCLTGAPGTPNGIYGCQYGEIDNLIRLNSSNPNSSAHEMGHHLGLMHPHNGASIYNPLLLTDKDIPYNDHPYNYSLASRELMLRNPDIDKLYTLPNCSFAGDFCCDTPATGWLSEENGTGLKSIPERYPAPGQPNCCNPGGGPLESGIFQTSVADGCLLSGSYKDYNGDSYEDQVDLQSIASNYMSHTYLNICGSLNFTEDQKMRFCNIYDARRSQQYENDKCGNHEDLVTFWDGPEIINEVSIQSRHNNSTKYANTFTTFEGKFSSILYSDELTSNVRKLGSKNGLDSDPYLPSDWREGLTVTDLTILARYIVGLQSLNGFQKLSSDVNNDGNIDAFDLIDIQKLILFVTDDFPNQNSPWKFIPEYIPTDHTTAFNNDPYNMDIDGVSTNGFPIYTENNWSYSILDGLNGVAGFNGYKLGDINKSSMLSPPVFANCYESDISISNDVIPVNQPIGIAVEVKDNINFESAELNFVLHESVEIADVTSSLNSFQELTSYSITENKGVQYLKLLVLNQNASKIVSKNYPVFEITMSSNESLPLSELITLDANAPSVFISDLDDCNTLAELEINVDIVGDEFSSKISNSGNLGSLIFPNPSEGNVFVDLSQYSFDIAVKIEIFDLNGKKINEVVTNEKMIRLETKDYPKGVYYINIFLDEIITQKFILN